MRTSSNGRASSSRSARSVATSSAALDDSPTPIGTFDVTWMSSGGTSKPTSSVTATQPWT